MHNDRPADSADQGDAARGPGVRGRAPDPLDAFPTEAQVAVKAVRRKRRQRFVDIGLAVGAAVLAVAAVGAWWWIPGVSQAVRQRLAGATAAGLLAIDTTPPGWDVIEGGRTLGITPLRVSLPPGPHALVLRNGSATRSLAVVLQDGMQVFHHLDLQAASAAVGVLSVSTLPPGAAIVVDGVRRGVAPVEVTDLEPGEHEVGITSGTRTLTERVSVAAGRTTTLVVPVGPPDAAGGAVGFVTIAAPIDLQVFDGDALVGSSRNQRIMLLPGKRTLRFANTAVGFERTTTVSVEAGVSTKLTVPVPNGTLSVNAVPWAEVLLDGRVIGETPIANFAVVPGSHEIVLRNPKFPEQKRTVVVSLTAPTRIGVDLRQ